MRILVAILAVFFSISSIKSSLASPIVSGISTNEINIDTKFNGAKILLFGAKEDMGDIVIAIRGPKKNFLVTKKEKFLGIWYNGKRIKFKEGYSFYKLFSTFSTSDEIDELLKNLELGKNNLQFIVSDKTVNNKVRDEFQLQLIERLESKKLFSDGAGKIDFLNETLFKVLLEFPKNITRGVYSVEIYLISEGNLVSFQSIPIYVNQVGISARILDFAYEQSFLYGLAAVAFALIVGWLANYLFLRFIGK
jgi:uncharacterized protein (TIGR02186 family)